MKAIKNVITSRHIILYFRNNSELNTFCCIIDSELPGALYCMGSNNSCKIFKGSIPISLQDYILETAKNFN